MKALGLIETRGLLAAIKSADTMLKSANVSIFDKTYVGGGLVSVAVTGDVGAVKVAVEAGVAAVKRLDSSLLVSEHVIPRPHEELDSIIGIRNTTMGIDDLNNNGNDTEDIQKISKHTGESNVIMDNPVDENSKDRNKADFSEIDIENLQKETVDNLVKDNGIEKAIEVLNKLKLTELRDLARQYNDLKITDEVISKTSKKLLITKIRAYYK